MKILVIEAIKGRVVESRIVEGKLSDIVKETAREALEKWNPDSSDFVAVKDVWSSDIRKEDNPDFYEKLEGLGLLAKMGDRTIIRIPVYTISYDNEMISEDDYKENGLYMIIPYIDEDVKAMFEREAADLTADEKEPPRTLTN